MKNGKKPNSLSPLGAVLVGNIGAQKRCALAVGVHQATVWKWCQDGPHASRPGIETACKVAAWLQDAPDLPELSVEEIMDTQFPPVPLRRTDRGSGNNIHQNESAVGFFGTPADLTPPRPRPLAPAAA